MAQFRLDGRKANIVQYFNDLPALTVEVFENPVPRDPGWSPNHWQKILLKNNMEE